MMLWCGLMLAIALLSGETPSQISRAMMLLAVGFVLGMLSLRP